MWGYPGPYLPPKQPKDNNPDLRYSELDKETIYRLRWEFIFDNPPIFEPVERHNIIGVEHILKKLDVYIAMLNNFTDLDKQNAELDTGVIFSGPPGSGKTFAARYIATQSKARFINISDFPRRKSRFLTEDVIALFGLMKQYVANNNAPLVAFWDEFETFANIGEDTEKTDALGRFKTELSGINGRMRGIFLIAATNQPHLIPADVARPGRLGKRIKFEALRRRAKRLLLEYLINSYSHDERIDFESLSHLLTADYPAQIEELVKDAWRKATVETLGTDKKAQLTNSLLATTLVEEARGVRMDITLDDEDLRAISVYEVGRAIVARTMKFPVQLLAIEKEGYADAFRIMQDERKSVNVPLSRLKDGIAICYGGIIAQELSGIEPNTKQISDFVSITNNVQRFIEEFRSNKITTAISISVLAEKRADQHLPSVESFGMKTLHDTTDEMNDLLKSQQALVRSIFNHYGLELIEKMAAILVEKGFLLQMDIDAFLDPGFKPSTDSVKKEKKPAGF